MKEGEPIIAIERGRNESKTFWQRIRREFKLGKRRRKLKIGTKVDIERGRNEN